VRRLSRHSIIVCRAFKNGTITEILGEEKFKPKV